MTTGKLPYGRQRIDDDDIAAVVQALTSDFLTTGPAVDTFERALAKAVGAEHAVACSSGTAALHLAATALNLGTGDWVLSSPITFLGATNAFLHTGADVCFADVSPATINLDLAAVARELQVQGERVRAFCVVHFAGAPANMPALAALARDRGIPIIEDAAHALGAVYKDAQGHTVRVGSCRHSLMTTFSFHPVKHVTTAEGGAITTNDAELAHRLRVLRNHGIEREPFADAARGTEPDGTPRPWYHEIRTRPGFNYRLSDVHAALGTSQLTKLEPSVAARRAQAADYCARLASSTVDALVQPLPAASDPGHAFHLFVVRIDFARAGVTRTQVMHALAAADIHTQVHYIPVPFQPYYRARYGDDLDIPIATAYYDACLSLPLYPGMPADGVERVVAALERALTGA